MIEELERIADPRRRAEAVRTVREIYRLIEWRIRPLVSHLGDDEIHRLLCHMAWIKYKYEGSAALQKLPTPPSSMHAVEPVPPSR